MEQQKQLRKYALHLDAYQIGFIEGVLSTIPEHDSRKESAEEICRSLESEFQEQMKE